MHTDLGDPAFDAATCPDCGVLLRDQDGGLVCPACGWTIDAGDVVVPAAFDGPDIADWRV
ncbi:ribosomal protein S27AE [Microbacterium resistens]|uniref:Ribosomal protein S27AE n=1 Tax=Microbacterium resistens TaxID=156977 RepID=A0ABU1SDP4_9MICO|nr:hypothetical protein [Microbacterium resistens]MDR6867707.1 ribosomal protein S27AE [Microbacterium resistens]